MPLALCFLCQKSIVTQCPLSYLNSQTIVTLTSKGFSKNWTSAMSVMTLSIIRYLFLKGWSPRFHYGIRFVRFVILRLLSQVIVLKTLLTPSVVKPLRTQVIVFCYERWVITSLYLCTKKQIRFSYLFYMPIFSMLIRLNILSLCYFITVLHTFMIR